MMQNVSCRYTCLTECWEHRQRLLLLPECHRRVHREGDIRAKLSEWGVFWSVKKAGGEGAIKGKKGRCKDRKQQRQRHGVWEGVMSRRCQEWPEGHVPWDWQPVSLEWLDQVERGLECHAKAFGLNSAGNWEPSRVTTQRIHKDKASEQGLLPFCSCDDHKVPCSEHHSLLPWK